MTAGWNADTLDMRVHEKYEWDEIKDAKNLRKHGVSFQDATEVFDDPYADEVLDKENSTIYEYRYRITGRIHNQMVVVTAFTPRGKRVRIISARKAEKREVEAYFDRFL